MGTTAQRVGLRGRPGARRCRRSMGRWAPSDALSGRGSCVLLALHLPLMLSTLWHTGSGVVQAEQRAVVHSVKHTHGLRSAFEIIWAPFAVSPLQANGPAYPAAAVHAPPPPALKVGQWFRAGFASCRGPSRCPNRAVTARSTRSGCAARSMVVTKHVTPVYHSSLHITPSTGLLAPRQALICRVMSQHIGLQGSIKDL